jgi:hypothetical protein
VLTYASPAVGASATDPVGPSGWSAKNWLGFALQLLFFVVTVCILARIASAADGGVNDVPEDEVPRG